MVKFIDQHKAACIILLEPIDRKADPDSSADADTD
jgi:hypothetical protein